MSGTWASGWALNDVVTVAEFAKGVGNVADLTLGSAAASIDFTGLPTTYAHIRIVLTARGDTAGTLTNVQLRFNNDSAANYDYQILNGSAAIAGASEAFAQTSIVAGVCAAATAGASIAGVTVIDVVAYAGTTFNKIATSLSDAKSGTASGNMTSYRISGHWRSTAAINRVTVFPAAGNFVTGSRASVYVWGA